MGLGKYTEWPFYDLDPRSLLWHRFEIFACLCDKVRTTHPITTKHGSFIHCLSHGYYPIRFRRSSVGYFYFGKFSLKNSDVLFKVKHYFGHISGLVDLIDVKQKWSASDWYWVQYVTFTFDLTHDLDLGCFKVKFRNSSISGIVGLIDVKWKWSELIWCWADCMTLPFDHTHDLDPGVKISRSKSAIALPQEWDGRLTWNEKDVSHPFMTMILTSVTLVGGGQVYRILTVVTPDVGVPSTYLVHRK